MRLMHGLERGTWKKRKIWLYAAILMPFVLATGMVLCLRIGMFTYAKEADAVIDLTLAQPDSSSVNPDASPESAESSRGDSDDPVSAGAEAGKPGFLVEDAAGPWSTMTDIELFHIAYENDEEVITVAGADGQKTIAPGTAGEYIFSLNNTGDTALDYHMETIVTFSDGENSYEIPLETRLSNYRGRYLLGSEDEWALMEKLNSVEEKATLGRNCHSTYVLEWRWPFESGRDEFDTLLGSLAVDRELRLTVTIKVAAEENPDPDAEGGSSQTGDASSLWLWITLAVSACMMAVVRRNEEKPDEAEQEKI